MAEQTDLSIDDLRGMLTASATDANDTEETPAPAAAEAADGETAPDSEPETEQQDKQDRDETGKFKGKEKEPEDAPGVKKRIGKLLEEKRRAEARTRELEELLAKGSQPAPAKAQETAKPAEAPNKPQSKDFDSYESYVEALTDWKIASKEAAQAQAAREREATEAQTAAQTAWSKRVEAALELHPDFHEVMAEAAELPISKAMHSAILEIERGPEVAYALASKPEEVKRIAKLGPLAAAAALGAIAAGLPDRSKPAAKPAAAAKALPKPPAKVAGGAPAGVDLNDEKVNQSVWAREFRKRLAKDA